MAAAVGVQAVVEGAAGVVAVAGAAVVVAAVPAGNNLNTWTPGNPGFGAGRESALKKE